MTQFQFLGIRIEVGLEIRDGQTIRMLIVHTQTTANIDMLHDDPALLQLVLKLVHAITEGFEVTHVENLRTDVEVETHELHVGKLVSLVDHRIHIAHGDTKLVLSQSGGDIRMGMGTHIGVQTECHARHLTLGCCQLVDDLQLRDALNVEAEDIIVKSEIDLPVTLANACIDNLLTGETSLD